MKKITEAQAEKLLQDGKTVTCQFSPRGIKVVTSLAELKRLKRLYQEGVQGFSLFDNDQKIRVPKKAKTLTLDEAVVKLHNYALLYFKTIENTSEITSYNELMDLVKKSKIRGMDFIIYEIQ